jgi:hypothetical protein
MKILASVSHEYKNSILKITNFINFFLKKKILDFSYISFIININYCFCNYLFFQIKNTVKLFHEYAVCNFSVG